MHGEQEFRLSPGPPFSLAPKKVTGGHVRPRSAVQAQGNIEDWLLALEAGRGLSSRVRVRVRGPRRSALCAKYEASMAISRAHLDPTGERVCNLDLILSVVSPHNPNPMI